jgi:paraquat-inducible protein A
MAFVHSRSIAANATGPDRFVALPLFAALVLLPVGVVLPLMTVETVFFFGDEFSILDGLIVLFEAGEVFLFVLLGLLGILLPVGRLLFAGFLWFYVPADEPRAQAVAAVIATLGKWSMLEVLILAIAIVSTKLSLLGEAHTNPGIYFFTGAVLCQMAGFQWLRAAGARVCARLANAPNPSAPPDLWNNVE